MKIRIITESASDFGKDIPSNVTVLPMPIRFGNEEYLDGVTIDHTRFYERLIEGDIMPETSLISPSVFEDAFRETLQEYDCVIAITISSKLSGTYQSAMIAADEFDGKVLVVDSLNATIGEQALVRMASEMVSEMDDPAEIVRILNEKKQNIHTLCVLDTLEYLKKGGRISSATALIGDLLSIKVVGGVRFGEIVIMGKARGSRNVNNLLIKEIEKANGIDFNSPICLGYTGLSDQLLQKYIRDSKSLYEGHEDSLKISSVGATIGTHLGPGCILVAFFSN